jgi:hypothetical protein
MYNLKSTIMKRLLLAFLLVAGTTAIATTASAQVYIGARIGIRAPFHRAYYAPQVVYNAPVYSAPAPLPYYDNGVVVDANVYNSYPVCRGYAHYPYYRHGYSRGYYHDYYRGSGMRRGRR